jgi:hypothetical protein
MFPCFQLKLNMHETLAIETLQEHLSCKRAKDFFHLAMWLSVNSAATRKVSWTTIQKAIKDSNFNLSKEEPAIVTEFSQTLLTLSREQPNYYFHHFSLFNKLDPSDEQIQGVASQFISHVIIEYLQSNRNAMFVHQFPALQQPILKEIDRLVDDLIKEGEVRILSRAVFEILANEMDAKRMQPEAFNLAISPIFLKLSKVKTDFIDDVAHPFFSLIDLNLLPFPDDYYTPELHKLQGRFIQSAPQVNMWDKEHLEKSLSLNTQQFLKELHHTSPTSKKRAAL